MDYQTYKTRKDALKVIEQMSGWDAKPVQLYIPDSPDANRNGNVWVIRCSENPLLYMRSDGYVR
jgi:hypothetical protein